MTHRHVHAVVLWLTLALASPAAWAAGPPELLDGPLKDARQQQQGLLNEVRNRLRDDVNRGKLSNAEANERYGKIANGVRDGFRLGDGRGADIDRLIKENATKFDKNGNAEINPKTNKPFSNIENTGSKPKNVGADVDLAAKTHEAANNVVEDWKGKYGTDAVEEHPHKFVNKATDTTLWRPCDNPACVAAKARDPDAFTTEGGRKRTGNSDAVSDPEGFALDNEAKFKHGLETYKQGMEDYNKGAATGDAELQAKGLAKQADGLKTVAKSVSKAGDAAGIKPENPPEGSTWSKADGLRNYKDPPELGMSEVADSVPAENAKVIQDFLADAEQKLNEAKEKLTKLGRETTDEARAAVKDALENAKVADTKNARTEPWDTKAAPAPKTNEQWNKEGAEAIEQRRQRVTESNQARAERNSELKGVKETFPDQFEPQQNERTAQGDQTREIPREDRGSQTAQNDQTREIPREDQGNRTPQGDQTRDIPREDQGNRTPQGDQTRDIPREGEARPAARAAELDPTVDMRPALDPTVEVPRPSESAAAPAATPETPTPRPPRPVPPEGISSFAEPSLTENMRQGARDGLLVGLPLAFINCAVRPDATFNGCVAATLKTVPVAALVGAMLTVPGAAVLANGIGAAALVKDIYDVASEYNQKNKAEEEADKKEDEAIRNADLKTFGDYLNNRCDFFGALQLANRLNLTKGVGLPGKLSSQNLQALIRGMDAEKRVGDLMAKAAKQTGSTEQATLNQALKAANGIPCLEKKVRDAMNVNPIKKVEEDPPATPKQGCPTLTPPDPRSGPTSTDHPLTEDVNADFSPPPCPGSGSQNQQASANPKSSDGPFGDDNRDPNLNDRSPPIWEPPPQETKRRGMCLQEAALEQEAADHLRELLRKPKTETTPAALTAARTSWKKTHDDLDDCANGRNGPKVADASPANQQKGTPPAPKPVPEGHKSPDGTVTPTESKPIEERHKPAAERKNPIEQERKPIAERQKPTVKQADPVRPTLPPTKEDVSNKAADLVKKSPSPAPSRVPQSDILANSTAISCRTTEQYRDAAGANRPSRPPAVKAE